VGPVIQVADPSDPRIDDYRNLTDAELRQREEPAAGLFMVEGGAVIRQLLVSAYPVRSLLLTERRLAELSPALAATAGDWPVFVAGNEILRAITGFPFHRGAMAAAGRRPAPHWRDVVGGPLVAVAEGIGDHENMGALFRNAAAFGVGAVLRVSMGHVLRVPCARLEPWPAALEELRAAGYRIVALTPDPEARSLDAMGPHQQERERVAVLLGAEGPGLTEGARSMADDLVRIPMASGVDSLNVATAAALAFHELARPPRMAPPALVPRHF
jgi:tRNA G18 (ribose-2'-O)-methylase SpoU